MEKQQIDLKYYAPPSAWNGRIDGTELDELRWHQQLQLLDLSIEKSELSEMPLQTLAILGFSCDEGVRRNKGRAGAANGPAAIRKMCANLPAVEGLQYLIDAGDVTCIDAQLEAAQETLATAVEVLIRRNYRPLLIGGGHEIVYGHYQGIKKAFSGEKIGVINIDAHFDLRAVGPEGASSGTGFWQIAQQEPLYYLAIGIQQHSNTPKLFAVAEQYNATYIPYTELSVEHEDTIRTVIDRFASEVDRIYLTIDLDAFSASIAPGVSAPASVGILPDAFFIRLLDRFLQQPKLVSVDIAEYNPLFDQDDRTARLAAFLAYRYALAF